MPTVGTVRPYAKTSRPSPVAGDKFISDNATTGVGATDWADLCAALQAALGNNMTVESVADAAARNGLAVTSGQVGKRLVRQADTGVFYIANAAGSGASVWTQWVTIPVSSATTQGVVELATAAEAQARTDTVRALTPSTGNELIAPFTNARAPRQGLVFDTAAQLSGSVPAAGTSDLACFVWLNPTNFAAERNAFGATTNGFGLNVTTTGILKTAKQGVGYTSAASTSAITAGKASLIGYVKSGTTGTYYINGAAVGTCTDSFDYTAAITALTTSGSAAWVGGWGPAYFYNRALSAAEVTALYESGAPAAADFNSANNTSLAVGDNSTFASDTGAWKAALGTKDISGGTINLTDGEAMYLDHTGIAYLPVGSKARFTVTVSALTGGSVKYYNGTSYVTFGSANGTYTVEYTVVGTGATRFYLRVDGGDCSFDNFTGFKLGLLLAPDATQPGNGYQWRDMSGNKADITLPTSGVTWALPSNRPNSVRGTLTWAGTHESKSLLGQRALPDGAVVTLVTSKATAASSGSGKTIGTTNSATRWAAAATYTTAKKVDTIANQLPAGTADADNDIVVDPDTANFTGSIEVEVHYAITQST